MSRILQDFTTKVPEWRPHVAPVDLDKATAAQLDALQVTPSNRKISDYVLVLAHDPETLKHRSPLFNAIMYNRGGLSRAEREMGAVAASVVNRCIYCAAVHAERYNQLAKDETAMAKIFADGARAVLAPRLKAILDFAMKLSNCPPNATADDMKALKEAGLDQEEILDLILSSSLFGWANRLMHTLGEPVAATDKGPVSGLNEPPAIGPRLQAQRKSRNLTLAELAKASGVSRSMLSEIERGDANPTYGTLWLLTRALGLDITSLISGASEETRAIDHQTEHSTPLIRSADGTCTLHILSPAAMVSVTEWYLLSFEPGGQLVSEPHAHGAVEHLHCTEGEIEVRSGGSTTLLHAGETARYAADVEHGLVSTGPTGAKAFLVVAFDPTKRTR